MKYTKLMAAVIANPQRQPNRTTAYAMTGMPTTLENFAEASKMDVALALSLRGNQWPVALDTAGNEGASATPRRSLAATIPQKPDATAVTAEAIVQRREPQRPTRVTPMRSTKRPMGIWR